MFRSSFQEDRVVKDSKLQGVFSKLAGVLPRAEDLGNNNPKTMSSDIIESVLADSPIPVQTNWNHNDVATHIPSPAPDDGDLLTTIVSLARRIECELRSAKRSHLACGEVLLPCGLLQRIARDIVSMAESEPCGLRGVQAVHLVRNVRALHQTGHRAVRPRHGLDFRAVFDPEAELRGMAFLAAVYQEPHTRRHHSGKSRLHTEQEKAIPLL
ncbi:hypothetical protein NQ317_008722 [Molorchus minor]|uniref:Uncharacterized protein n=1 Tax=Molorchus minor TaxID=1323400 RepID=A0ABQ9J6Q0_9CUCU|nr:hypothetical protein NQ317_008722 [Molorchus minor]